MSRWFRHYAGMMRDEKLVGAAIRAKQPIERVVWVWGAILESASEINDGGKYEFDAMEVAYFLRADEADIRAVLDALTAAGRLAEGVVVNWSARQFQSDRSAPRQAAYRERKRSRDGDGDNQQTSGDGVVTSPERHRDAPDTETETNTETERKKDSSPVAKATRPQAKFDEFWQERPRRKGDDPRKPAEDQFFRLVKSGEDPDAIIAGAKLARVAYASEGKLNTEFVPQAVKWLRDRRYRDFAEAAKPAEPFDDGNVYVTSEEALSAWDAYGKATRGKTFPRDPRGGWRFPTQWPPGHVPRETNNEAPPMRAQGF